MAGGKQWSHARVRKNAEARRRAGAARAGGRCGVGGRAVPSSAPGSGRGPKGAKAPQRAAGKAGSKARQRELLQRIEERARQEREEAANRVGPRGGRTPRVAERYVVAKSVRKSMQGNKGKDTKPELLVRERLRAAGLTGYRLHWKVPGRPDVAWPGKKVCILVNGCFWHRCPHCRPRMPKSNVEYWTVKFDRNLERDERNLRELRAMGWTVHVVWECQLKKGAVDATMAELLPQLARELGKELRGPAHGAEGSAV